ncbi:MAG: phosphatidylserine decarboxylase family protein [Desulfovibrionaceae bacterium]|nr:phosphatidylserine decarboxylase family protein [Desulfovibrionaceae bacterium]
MRKSSIGIAGEGAPSLLLLALATLASAMLGCTLFTVLFFLLFAFCLHFFRDPERIVPRGEGIAVSPADGRVVSIRTASDPITGNPRQCMGIFMNLTNVHVNRLPVDGEILDIRYFPGKFINAAWDKASTDNERCAYLVKDSAGNEWTVVQIAGLIARRIVSYVEPGDKLKSGQRMGMIRFGSRVDVYLPEGFEPVVGVGDRVWAGETLIAKNQDKAA